MSEIVWKEVLSQLEKTVSRPNFVTWLKPTRFIRCQDGLVTLAVANPYAKNWIEKNCRPQIIEFLREYIPEAEQLSFETVESENRKPLEDLPLLRQEDPITEISPKKSEADAYIDEAISSQFNPQYTFDTFVVGNNNRLAFAASQAVAEKPGNAYNPLFMYGGVGLGKTHLMQAIGNEILRRNPKKKIIYTSCEIFTSEFIYALQTKTINDFKKKYRTIDVLLIDDIQFLANKEGTQEEFFHTFNILHQSGRQIVLTSDRVPKEMTSLEDRLISRFGWGLIADIQSPNFETRLAILQSKAEEKNLEIPQDVLEFIANTITNNVRELEGSLLKLATAANLEGVVITKEFAARCLKDLLNKPTGTPVSAKKVIQAVADHFTVEVSDILRKKRIKELVYPRQIVMYILREKLNLSYPQIGEVLGGKDHTTVMHGVQKIEGLRKNNQQTDNDIQVIEGALS